SLFLMVSLIFFICSYASALTFEEELNHQVIKLIEKPFKFEKLLDGFGIKRTELFIEGRAIITKYVHINASFSQIRNPERYAHGFDEYIVDYTCRDNGSRHLIRNGASFKFMYYSNDNQLIRTIIIDSDMCGFK
ncbi:MAG: hypothetical protein KKA35_02475, partial [Proteobacteria bacterium]|nr:hypothetical protein [Pseudomonadota bacterium]